jgi:hypothetical protein
MRRLHTVTVRLTEDEWDRLRAEADRLGIPPGTAARILLRASMAGTAPDAMEGLRRLADLRRGLPAVDVVDLLGAARAELERR